jgi:hypothetical protein
LWKSSVVTEGSEALAAYPPAPIEDLLFTLFASDKTLTFRSSSCGTPSLIVEGEEARFQPLFMRFADTQLLRMADQVGQGSSFHLFHDTTAVSLYGPLGGSQSVGHLFIRHPGHERGEYLVLPGRQGIDSLQNR